MASQTPEDLEQCFKDMDETQDIRKRIYRGIVDEAVSSKDPEMLRTAMQALDGADKNSMSRLKLNEKAKENATSASEVEALSQYLVHLSGNNAAPRVASDRPNDTRNQSLPEDRRPTYDPTVRDTTATGENTSDFKDRVEKKLPPRS